jgi:hypothetical protein
MHTLYTLSQRPDTLVPQVAPVRQCAIANKELRRAFGNSVRDFAIESSWLTCSGIDHMPETYRQNGRRAAIGRFLLRFA